MKIIDFFNFGGYMGAPKNPKNDSGGFGAPKYPPKLKKKYFF